MSLILDLEFSKENGVVDTVNNAVSGFYAGVDAYEVYENVSIHGSNYNVLTFPRVDQSQETFFSTLPAISGSEWSTQILMRTHDWNHDGFFLLGDTVEARFWNGDIDQIGAVIPCPKNEWILLTLRYNGTSGEAWINDEKVADLTNIAYTAGTIRLGSYSTNTYNPRLEYAAMRFYDEYIDDPTTSPNDSDVNSQSTLSGMVYKEELDGGNQVEITRVGTNGVDIGFPGTVCWGCLRGMITDPTRAPFRIEGNLSWETIVEGTGHISSQLQLVGLYGDDSRSDDRAQLFMDLAADNVTPLGIYLRTFTDLGASAELVQIAGPSECTPDIIRDFSLEVTEDSVIGTWGDASETLSRSFTTCESYMIGGNLGVHYGTPEDLWTMSYRDLEIYHVPYVGGGLNELTSPFGSGNSWNDREVLINTRIGLYNDMTWSVGGKPQSYWNTEE